MARHGSMGGRSDGLIAFRPKENNAPSKPVQFHIHVKRRMLISLFKKFVEHSIKKYNTSLFEAVVGHHIITSRTITYFLLY